MTPDDQKMVLIAEAVSKRYRQGGQEIDVLDGVSFEVGTGESVAIVGVSGSGKSTLLHLLAGLDQPDQGSITIAGHNLSRASAKQAGDIRNRHIGFVYQFHHLLSEFSALENVAMPLMIGGEGKTAARARAEELLREVGLTHRLAHHPGQLSGGERQRVAIARALAMRPDLVLADEPTGNLDEQSADQIHDLMLRLAAESGIAFVVVTHNTQFARRMQQVYRLHGGKLEPDS
ncbi:MAG: lipoprotein-releasing ABC transporter ATP-binding protein LolD [Pseudomonadales bacterium]